jgi:hypothetical protein
VSLDDDTGITNENASDTIAEIQSFFRSKHLAAAVLHPLSRKLTFTTTYDKSIAYPYI